MQIVRLDDVILGVRGRKDQDGHAPEIGVALDIGQELAAVAPREVQIQEYQVGPRCVGEWPLAPEERQRLLPVARDAQPAPEGSLLQHLVRETHVARVVLDQEDLENPLRVRLPHGDPA